MECKEPCISNGAPQCNGLIDYKLECKVAFPPSEWYNLLGLIDYKLECKGT